MLCILMYKVGEFTDSLCGLSATDDHKGNSFFSFLRMQKPKH